MSADNLDLGELDPGIRDVVRWLRGNGWCTTDSGDGVSKPEESRVFDAPHVVIVVDDPAELVDAADRLWAEVEALGVEEDPRVDDDGYPVNPLDVQASYNPGQGGIVSLLLIGLDDTMLIAARAQVN